MVLIIIWLNNPNLRVSSLQSGLLKIIPSFGQISGYKVNVSLSYYFLTDKPYGPSLLFIYGYGYDPFIYLGVSVTHTITDLFKDNLEPALKTKQDLNPWSTIN
uniref:Uncharacterized protein n=1 Tax=Sphaeramia orbicularis TaxID=375764 RepID=A0A672Z737_9TELE